MKARYTKEVLFLEDSKETGGIALYDKDKHLLCVICAHCGRIVDPETAKIVDVYPDWVSFSEEIID